MMNTPDIEVLARETLLKVISAYDKGKHEDEVPIILSAFQGVVAEKAAELLNTEAILGSYQVQCDQLTAQLAEAKELLHRWINVHPIVLGTNVAKYTEIFLAGELAQPENERNQVE